MAEVAAHLTDEVIPHLPTRQWVLSVPKRLRPFLHQTPQVASAVLALFLRALRSALRDASPGAPAAVRDAQLLARGHRREALVARCSRSSAPSAAVRCASSPCVTLPSTLERILRHLDLPHRPPRVSAARGPPEAELDLDQSPACELAAPEALPEFECDQSPPQDWKI